MAHDTPSNFPTHAIEHASEISRLSKHEAGRMLMQAQQARLAEIDRYWALCQTDPDQAAHLAADATPIVSDIFYPARNVPLSLRRVPSRACQKRQDACLQ